MRYAIISCAALCACLVVSWLLIGLSAKQRGISYSKVKQGLLSMLVTLLVGAYAAYVCISRPYLPDETATRALASSDGVTVTKQDGGYLFDGPGDRTALLFLSGMLVEPESYAPLMHDLAEDGVDCMLVDAPLNIAYLSTPSLERLVATHPYQYLILAGHSLGGVAASSYVTAHPQTFDALVLLASYPASQLPDDLAFLTVTATEDGVLDQDEYDQARSLWPKNTRQFLVRGGNHAGFGSYGPQRGDGTATIDQDEQRRQVTGAIVALARELEGEL